MSETMATRIALPGYRNTCGEGLPRRIDNEQFSRSGKVHPAGVPVHAKPVYAKYEGGANEGALLGSSLWFIWTERGAAGSRAVNAGRSLRQLNPPLVPARLLDPLSPGRRAWCFFVNIKVRLYRLQPRRTSRISENPPSARRKRARRTRCGF